MKTLHIDIETYSDVDLKKFGVYRYADSPNFTILLLAYAVDAGPVQVVDLAQGERLPKEIMAALTDLKVTKKAYNAQFERVCLDRALSAKTGPWECTMIRAAMMGLSGSLDHVGKAVGIDPDQRKLETGKNLIRLFCLPRKPSMANGMKKIFEPRDRPLEWVQFKSYCQTDVEAERAIDQKLCFLPVPEREWTLYDLDQAINDRGVGLDLDLAEAAMDLDAQQTKKLEARYHQLTGIDSPRKLQQLKDWLRQETGEEVKSITKANLDTLIETYADYPEVAEALEIRQRMSRSSVAKYKAMLGLACEDRRARGLFRYYGAATGRWSGRGIQPQNLPRNYLADLDTARATIRQRDLDWMQLLYDDPSDVLSQCIRTALVPAAGTLFAVADYSAIEARIIAWLSGETWRLDVFRTHGKIYEASAAQMFKVPIESIGKGSDLRQKGKVAELALGYQGSVGALKQMGALKMGVPEDALQGLVDKWREANPRIVSLWYEVERAARACIETRTQQIVGGIVRMTYHRGILFIRLPSGRALAYPRASLRPHQKFPDRDEVVYSEVSGDGWKQVGTYGGKLVENIIQAIARDCLAEGMLAVTAAGFRIVMHVHDEIVVEVPTQHDPEAALAEILGLMRISPDWAKDLPLNADGYLCPYYQKD